MIDFAKIRTATSGGGNNGLLIYLRPALVGGWIHGIRNT